MRVALMACAVLASCAINTETAYRDNFDITTVLNGSILDQSQFIRSFDKDRATVSDLIESLVIMGNNTWKTVEDRSYRNWVRVTVETSEIGKYDITFLNETDKNRSNFAVLPHWDNPDQAVQFGYALSELTDSGECNYITGKRANRLLPMASVSKLATAGAVLDAIRSEKLDINDELQITDSVRSLPSGTWHTLAIGTKRSIRRALQSMYIASDNTAHDLLLNRMGRTAVYNYAVEYMGHNPDLPFLTTSELFKLSWSASPELQSLFFESSYNTRIELLENDINYLKLPLLTLDEDPVDPFQLQWFAKLGMICTVWADLLASPYWKQITVGSMNPLEFRIQGWGSLGHKYGLSPGVRSFSGAAVLHCGAIVIYSASISSNDRLREESVFHIATILSGHAVEIEGILCGSQ